jgi:nucleoid-associated protein YgaU
MKTRTNMKAGSACYTVKSGDNLSRISQKFYGNQYPANVDKIYQTNLTTIGPNKSLIYPGLKLYIPD